MAGVMKTNSDGFKRFDRGAISHRLEQLERVERLRHRIKRCRNTALDLTTPMPMAQLPLRFLFLNESAVRQQDFEQIDGCRGGVDRPLVTQHGQARQQAGVIDVGMRQ